MGCINYIRLCSNEVESKHWETIKLYSKEGLSSSSILGLRYFSPLVADSPPSLTAGHALIGWMRNQLHLFALGVAES